MYKSVYNLLSDFVNSYNNKKTDDSNNLKVIFKRESLSSIPNGAAVLIIKVGNS